MLIKEKVENKMAEKERQEQGLKYDSGKPRIFEMLEDFKEPLTEVAKVWAFGADKYKNTIGHLLIMPLIDIQMRWFGIW